MRRIARALALALLTEAWLQAVPGSGWAAAAAETSAAASPSVQVAGAVERPKAYGLADLRAFPATTLAVHYATGKGPVAASFTGVLLWTLLQEAGIRTDPKVKNDVLRRTATLTAADGYQVVLGLGEIDPEFGGEPAIVAYAQDGAPLPAGDGIARLILPGDKTAGRNLFALMRIEVR